MYKYFLWFNGRGTSWYGGDDRQARRKAARYLRLFCRDVPNRDYFGPMKVYLLRSGWFDPDVRVVPCSRITLECFHGEYREDFIRAFEGRERARRKRVI